MTKARRTGLIRWHHRPARFFISMVSATALVAILAVPCASAATMVRPQVLVADSGPAAGTDVTLTSKTIVVPPSVVQSSLASVSANGSTYTFSNASGPLAQAAPGKVLLLEGKDAIVVQSVKHSGKSLIIGAAPASLTDVVQSGTIKVSSAPDPGAAVGVPQDTSSFSGVSPQGLFLGAPSPAPGRATLTGATFAYQGSSNGFTYKVSFAGLANGVDATADICYTVAASSCGGGLSINVTLDGILTWSNQEVDIGVGGGSVHSGSFTMSDMSSNIKLDYTVLRGEEPNVGAKPPVIKIPFAFEMPLCGTPLGCAGLPLYSKVELALLVTLGISAKNSSIVGGVKLTIGGTGTVSGSKLGGVSGSLTGGTVKGSFTPGTTLTLGASGVVVAVQTKFGVGLGVRNINGLYYISAITSVGETTGSLVAGQSCAKFDGDFSITGNFEAQLFGFSISTPAKTLYDKKASYAQPGC